LAECRVERAKTIGVTTTVNSLRIVNKASENARDNSEDSDTPRTCSRTGLQDRVPPVGLLRQFSRSISRLLSRTICFCLNVRLRFGGPLLNGNSVPPETAFRHKRGQTSCVAHEKFPRSHCQGTTAAAHHTYGRATCVSVVISLSWLCRLHIAAVLLDFAYRSGCTCVTHAVTNPPTHGDAHTSPHFR